MLKKSNESFTFSSIEPQTIESHKHVGMVFCLAIVTGTSKVFGNVWPFELTGKPR